MVKEIPFFEKLDTVGVGDELANGYFDAFLPLSFLFFHCAIALLRASMAACTATRLSIGGYARLAGCDSARHANLCLIRVRP